jgi:transposase-like protein
MHPPELILDTLRLHAEGNTVQQLATKLDINESVIRRWRRRHAADPSWPSTRITVCTSDLHGTVTAYRRGCRCPEARAAIAAAQRRVYNQTAILGTSLMTSSTGTRRRLQGLLRQGWTTLHTSRAVDANLSSVITGRTSTIHVTTARRVADLTEKLRTREGPNAAAARQAVKLGYMPLEAWTHIDNENEQPNPNIPDPMFIPVCGLQRRYRGLMLLGWNSCHIQEAGGPNRCQLSKLSKQPPTFMATRKQDRSMIEATRQLLMKGTGPDIHLAGIARTRRYVPLMLWDEEHIYNPAATPTLTFAKR